eukprot:TRINITY_DN7576_c0_g1_i6.p3 TRINITY_DN7576_c0_g1~~TRINITY_DN7576_c0_g1_i6.p3  ORF type:complete len:127 (-),score=2.31 TRINITY_DN7576_c0_g1_i6:145-525(-)
MLGSILYMLLLKKENLCKICQNLGLLVVRQCLNMMSQQQDGISSQVILCNDIFRLGQVLVIITITFGCTSSYERKLFVFRALNFTYGLDFYVNILNFMFGGYFGSLIQTDFRVLLMLFSKQQIIKQ